MHEKAFKNLSNLRSDLQTKVPGKTSCKNLRMIDISPLDLLSTKGRDNHSCFYTASKWGMSSKGKKSAPLDYMVGNPYLNWHFGDNLYCFIKVNVEGFSVRKTDKIGWFLNLALLLIAKLDFKKDTERTQGHFPTQFWLRFKLKIQVEPFSPFLLSYSFPSWVDYVLC